VAVASDGEKEEKEKGDTGAAVKTLDSLPLTVRRHSVDKYGMYDAHVLNARSIDRHVIH